MIYLSKDPIEMSGLGEFFSEEQIGKMTSVQKKVYNVVVILLTITLAPIIEESFCHYLLYPYFPNSVVTILFTLAHTQYLNPPFDIFTGSIACGIVSIIRHVIGVHNDLLTKIILHAIHNFIAIIVTFKISPVLMKQINNTD